MAALALVDKDKYDDLAMQEGERAEEEKKRRWRDGSCPVLSHLRVALYPGKSWCRPMAVTEIPWPETKLMNPAST